MKKYIHFLISFLFLLDGYISGCKPVTEIDGNSQLASWSEKEDSDVDLETVPEVNQVSSGRFQITAGCKNKAVSIESVNNTKVTIVGKLCSLDKGSSGNNKNIVFIVDKSTSMSSTDSECNRKVGIAKVISNIMDNNPGISLNGAVVVFGKYASATGWAKLSYLSYSHVCGKGGSGDWADTGATNYEAAFDKAREILQGKSGENIIYFITDGAPNIASSSPTDDRDYWQSGASAGKAALEVLRISIKNLTVNTVYLIDPSVNNPLWKLQHVDAPSESETKDYLVEIMGGTDRVKVAKKSADIVSQLESFDVTSSTTSILKDLTATVSVGGEKKNVRVEKIENSPEGGFSYRLEETRLKGNSEGTWENEFVISGTDSNGKTMSSTLKVKFRVNY